MVMKFIDNILAFSVYYNRQSFRYKRLFEMLTVGFGALKLCTSSVPLEGRRYKRNRRSSLISSSHIAKMRSFRLVARQWCASCISGSSPI
jgi:hypothetical protein